VEETQVSDKSLKTVLVTLHPDYLWLPLLFCLNEIHESSSKDSSLHDPNSVVPRTYTWLLSFSTASKTHRTHPNKGAQEDPGEKSSTLYQWSVNSKQTDNAGKLSCRDAFALRGLFYFLLHFLHFNLVVLDRSETIRTIS
jgi:hypothetical protein